MYTIIECTHAQSGIVQPKRRVVRQITTAGEADKKRSSTR